jgi:porin
MSFRFGRLRWGIHAFIGACLLSFQAAPVMAQTAPQTPNLSMPFTLAPLGKTLAADGIYLSGGYVEDILAVVAGGRNHGTLPAGELFFGSTLDLQTLLGITGASFHIVFDSRNGNSASNFAGTNFGLTAIHGPTNTIRLSNLYWEQGFDHDRIDFTVGRTNPTSDFATSDISCEFISNLFCAQPGIWYSINQNQAYPTSTWGGRANFQITPAVYVRAGAYEDDPSQNLATEHGFTWNTHNAVGAFLPFEIGYSTLFTGARYPAKYTIGGYYDTGSFNQPGTPLNSMRGRTAFYAQAQQTVWRPSAKSSQSLTVFAGVLKQTGGFAPYTGEYYGGLYDRGPFLSRPNDTIGFAAALIATNKLSGAAFWNEWLLELNYGFSVIPGVTVKPVIEYVIHPDAIGFPPNPSKVQNALVIGTQLSINFNGALQLPQFIPH